jgi:biotin carboxyl carrier protein
MRHFRVQVNEKSYLISVEPMDKGKFRVTVDGATYETETVSDLEVAAWVVKSPNETFLTHAKAFPVDRVDVWIADMPFQASVQVIGIGGYALAPEPQMSVSSGEVTALMPGRITSVLVREGETVSEGNALLILEAMKMQNEITSPISGRVKSILVQEGTTVKKDAKLVLIEPKGE